MYTVCENPSIIRHPNSEQFLHHSIAIYIDGKVRDIYASDWFMIHRDFLAWLRKYTPSAKSVIDVKKYYFVDSNGEMLPMYLEVPCNHCVACRMRRINSLSQQAEFELLNNYPNCDSFYITLTYAPWRIPKDELLHKEHVVNYIKKIRTYISKHFGNEYSRQMKVMYAGEYGKEGTNRPHFHVIFYHFPFYKFQTPKYQTIKFFEYMWSYYKNVNDKDTLSFDNYTIDAYGKYTAESSKHFRKHCIGNVYVEKLYSGNLSKYIAKYVGKEVGNKNDDDNCKYSARFVEKCKQSPQFFRKSINFGMRIFTSLISPQIDNNKKNTFKYMDLNFKVKDGHLCSYYISKKFPTLSRIVPSEVRKLYSKIRWCLSEMAIRISCNLGRHLKRYVKRMDYIASYAEQLCPNLKVNYYKDCDRKTRNTKEAFSFSWYYKQCYIAIYQVHYYFNSLKNKGLTFNKIEKLINDRNLFISNSLSEISIPDSIFQLKQQYNKILESRLL